MSGGAEFVRLQITARGHTLLCTRPYLYLLIFRSIEDAIKAQRRTHQSTFRGRTITVEFVQGRDRWGAGSLCAAALAQLP